MNIVYSEMPFSTDSFQVDTSQLVCFANHLIVFYMMWGFNKIYFKSEHNTNIMNLMSMTFNHFLNFTNRWNLIQHYKAKFLILWRKD